MFRHCTTIDYSTFIHHDFEFIILNEFLKAGEKALFHHLIDFRADLVVADFLKGHFPVHSNFLICHNATPVACEHNMQLSCKTYRRLAGRSSERVLSVLNCVLDTFIFTILLVLTIMLLISHYFTFYYYTFVNKKPKFYIH